MENRRPRPPARRSPRRPLMAALLAAAVALVPACSAESTTADAAGDKVLAALPKAVPEALAPFYGQRPAWRTCEGAGKEEFECARLKAPLDYDDPTAGTLDLALSRKKATGPGSRLGSLLVNPGGPGGSAIGYLQSYAALGYPAPVRARYDMVAVDPRGVADSEPVTCLDGPAMDAHTATDTTPDTPAERQALVSAFQKYGKGCQADAGKTLGHVSTIESARDLDLARSALGDEKLTYVGASYGTFLGATYAGLYPHRVGRLVLDGAMDPTLDARRLNLEQTAGFDTAFTAFAKDCAQRKDCPLGAGGPQGAGRNLTAFFDKLDAAPLPAGQGRALTESLATMGVVAALYDEAGWPQLRTALTSAIKDRDGNALLALSDLYHERDADGGYQNLMSANAAVNCLDLPPAFADPEEVEAALPEFRKASPVFGEGFAWASLNCAQWPTPATSGPHRIEASGAAPVVVVGTTRDPATPYRWARGLASQLDSATLLTYEGDGHTAFGRGSDCIDTAINTYLLEGTPPDNGTRC
ncbi:alpha/beta hydrolase [Streptomyces albidoflavus]|uniref:alpha/beta hydrolase n=1 Tax=Streptomyces TaxID=1883 RepID=UPI001E3FAA0F|nr:alpha/beta hydrolase [Streptomyces sp. OUCMDZ-3434]WSB21698.1 alpha/beta hydrolase [Streptomyces albidoflavus]